MSSNPLKRETSEKLDNQNKKVKINDDDDNKSAKKYMPLRNLSAKASSSFKSPLLNRIVNKNINDNENKLEEKINSLEQTLSNIEIEISGLEKENSIKDLGNASLKLFVNSIFIL
jgi:hypothetical protein